MMPHTPRRENHHHGAITGRSDTWVDACAYAVVEKSFSSSRLRFTYIKLFFIFIPLTICMIVVTARLSFKYVISMFNATLLYRNVCTVDFFFFFFLICA